MQTAVNLPPAIMTPVTLTPPRPPLVSVVSVEPAEPGILIRGINACLRAESSAPAQLQGGEQLARRVLCARSSLNSPPSWSLENPSPASVDVKVWIDKSGQVTKAELLSDSSDSAVADLAANAALKWTFEPARLSDRPVSSEMVMHFRFAPKRNF